MGRRGPIQIRFNPASRNPREPRNNPLYAYLTEQLRSPWNFKSFFLAFNSFQMELSACLIRSRWNFTSPKLLAKIHNPLKLESFSVTSLADSGKFLITLDNRSPWNFKSFSMERNSFQLEFLTHLIRSKRNLIRSPWKPIAVIIEEFAKTAPLISKSLYINRGIEFYG